MVSGTLQKLSKYAVRKLTTSKQGQNTYKKCYRCWHITDSSLRFQVWQKLPAASQANSRIFLGLSSTFQGLTRTKFIFQHIQSLVIATVFKDEQQPCLQADLDTTTRHIHSRLASTDPHSKGKREGNKKW